MRRWITMPVLKSNELDHPFNILRSRRKKEIGKEGSKTASDPRNKSGFSVSLSSARTHARETEPCAVLSAIEVRERGGGEREKREKERKSERSAGKIFSPPSTFLAQSELEARASRAENTKSTYEEHFRCGLQNNTTLLQD